MLGKFASFRNAFKYLLKHCVYTHSKALCFHPSREAFKNTEDQRGRRGSSQVKDKKGATKTFKLNFYSTILMFLISLLLTQEFTASKILFYD